MDNLKEYILKKLDSGKDSILTLKGGAAIDLMDNALQKVLSNIADINTTAGVREIVLKIQAKPMDEGRNVVAYTISVAPPKLCGQAAEQCAADISIDGNGRGVFSKEKRKSQQDIPFGNVTSINRE